MIKIKILTQLQSVLDDDECYIPLLDRAQITATSSLPERGPQNARLNGKKRHSSILISILFSCVFTFILDVNYCTIVYT